MRGPFTAWFDAEHRQLARRMRRVLVESGELHLDAYPAFCRGVLHHVAAQELVLFPALLARLGHEPLYRPALTRDHGGLVSLCAPTPTREWLEGLWTQLELHHDVERADHGFARQCDALLAEDAVGLLARAEALPELDVPPLSGQGGLRGLLHALFRETGLAAH